MLKNLWAKIKAIAEGKDTMDEATFQAQHKLLVDLNNRLVSVEDYLHNTPNHIGQVFTPASTDEATASTAVDEPAKNPDGSLSDGMS